MAGATPGELLERELQGADGQLVLGAEDPAAPIEQAETEIVRWERAGHRLLTALDPDYPANLHLVHDRPPLLFVAGRLTPQDTRSVAIIGTRSATPAALAVAAELSRDLGSRGFTVVSGLARGIDTAAHRAAIDSRQRTVAVIGTGLGRVYPPENGRLQEQIGREGAVVSCFWPGEPPSPETFRRRNAVMSGLALGTVIIEGGERSGVRVQARRALAHGRPVFLWHELERETWARELSERPGVYIIAAADEVTGTLDRLWSHPLGEE